MAGLTKLLRKAIRRVRELPAQDQDALAEALLSMLGGKGEVVDLDDSTLSAIEEGLAQAELGGFATDDFFAVIDEPHFATHPTPVLAPPYGDDCSAGGERRVLHLLPIADQRGWMAPSVEVIAPTPEVIAPTPVLVVGNGTASTVTIDQPSSAAVAEE
jgi:hypothetical protein